MSDITVDIVLGVKLWEELRIRALHAVIPSHCQTSKTDR